MFEEKLNPTLKEIKKEIEENNTLLTSVYGILCELKNSIERAAEEIIRTIKERS